MCGVNVRRECAARVSARVGRFGDSAEGRSWGLSERLCSEAVRGQRVVGNEVPGYTVAEIV